MSTLSTPIQKREMIRHFVLLPIMAAVILAYVTSAASALAATCKIDMEVGSAANRNSAPTFDSTLRAGSRFGKTESETATSNGGIATVASLLPYVPLK